MKIVKITLINPGRTVPRLSANYYGGVTMELETVVLENTAEINLDNAQEAYNDYPQAKENFRGKRAEYAALVADLKSRHYAAITKQEIEKADNVYEEVKQLQQECLDMKSILSRKLETLILESKELEGDLGYHSKHLTDAEDIECGRELLQEAIELRDGGETTDAVEKAYQARECLSRLLAQAKSAWIRKHEKKIESLSINQNV